MTCDECRDQPHRLRTFKRSNDPNFIAKLEDIVALYMTPPAHALVLSIDEKSQIQVLDRTQPGLPLKPGKCGTMTLTCSNRASCYQCGLRLSSISAYGTEVDHCDHQAWSQCPVSFEESER